MNQMISQQKQFADKTSCELQLEEETLTLSKVEVFRI